MKVYTTITTAKAKKHIAYIRLDLLSIELNVPVTLPNELGFSSLVVLSIASYISLARMCLRYIFQPNNAKSIASTHDVTLIYHALLHWISNNTISTQVTHRTAKFSLLEKNFFSFDIKFITKPFLE